jgi:two-component system, cell cycle sensor histidine kinase and response regulator CckA
VKALGIILAAGERGRKLVRGLTDFARKGLEDARPVALNALIRKDVELLQSTTLRKVDFVLDLAPELPLVLGEPSALDNALMNLCVNALDAMPDGGELTFRTRVSPTGQVEVTVADTGQGMSPAVRARAMEPFFTTKPVGKGTGLGLAGVYGTMKAHGGDVDILSEEGRGTQVRLHFPPLAAAPEPPPPPEAPPLPDAAPMRILMVDDDPAIQESVPGILEYLGHTVTTAARGQEAMELLEAGLEVDLVVLDHNMPGLTGAETLVRLKDLRPGLPVLLSTGFLEPGVEDLARRYPAVWLLNKPYSLTGLREKILRVQAETKA